MAISRRDLLKLTLAGAAHPLLPLRGILSQAYAAPGAADARFLLVFLRGGYDAANVLVPVTSELYYRSRPTIAVARPDPANPDAGDRAGRSGRRAALGAASGAARVAAADLGEAARWRSSRSPAPTT